MKIFRIILLGCLLLGTLWMCSISGDKDPEYVKIADRITAKVAKKLKEDKGLHACGVSGRMMDDVEEMGLSFQLYHLVSYDEARELIVYAASEYLAAINSSQTVRPFLHNYPFTSKNVEIFIWIYEAGGNDPPKDAIDFLTLSGGVISYYVDRTIGYPRVPVFEESFEEAAKKLHSPSPEIEQALQFENAVAIRFGSDGALAILNLSESEPLSYELEGKCFCPNEPFVIFSDVSGKVSHFKGNADSKGDVHLKFKLARQELGEANCFLRILRPDGRIRMDFTLDQKPLPYPTRASIVHSQ